ncbi:luciferase [Streptococcus azizii]|uniref:Luciferase n=1 Tax=Streptococcus azizii TaxID=1579424 RepID=A0AB36JQR2_9STRE|nr:MULTISPECIES: LLM class flavin-dependent oxidoreductase [Streptococcus]MBF0776621.1 LLM class flavin-dependent oxidoreductase [Streptococcus sp. 19428wD3_AN2]ONK26183.1 luciferase [Streptococcus azizii]ONK26683.1 luciferase [Streptococcus azizii]ONK27594.1 luciferase [Streptococcus azizii]TFU82717.1 LLM class flavin-dependent oxidoreductase [Streptococcus sp. AN2]
MVELGISTFGETTPLEKTGQAVSHAERIRNLVEEIELADQVGLDVYAVGEHHWEDFAVSAPEIVLAAGAVNTKHIRLSSAVTILSSIDPVRVYQQYATIDALSNGRAEIMAGRGSFIESFPLFGYDLKDYEALFDEKLEMLLAIKNDTHLTWQGQHTQSVENRPVYPRAVQEDFPIKIATGGSPESTQKIASQGLPIVYAIIGGNPRYFKPLIDMYRKIGRLKGHDESKMTVGAHSWGWIAEDKGQAERDYFYPTKQLVDAISKDRPFWKELTYDAYLKNIGEEGAMFVGDPDTVANKMIWMIETLGLDSFMLHLPVGSMPHEDTLKAIRLYGEKVAPKVRAYFDAKEK